MILIPIRTETPIRRTPLANYVLIGLNVLFFLVLDAPRQPQMQQFKDQYLVLHADVPRLHEFATYQFIHADWMHLLGNMLFLWVFGNAVNAKMGQVAYVLFYLAGGVFAAFGYALGGTADLLGASGAIAAVTAAYLALFPRSHVTVLYWMLLVGTFELRAMIVIGFKIILWDNILAPSVMGAGNVAVEAHLAGYLFGFVVALGMLLARMLPRDQFDMLALWKRWNQRRAYRAVMADPKARAEAQFGRVARPVSAAPQQRDAEEQRLDRVSELRVRIGECLESGDTGPAATLYEQLIDIDPKQCLSARHQMLMAREFYATGRFPQATASFERFLDSYGSDPEADEVRMLVGIIYTRDLQQFEAAERHLSAVYERLQDPARRAQCSQWLEQARQALGRPPAEG
ncbi:MAG: rhomboid family intramembrane serine protease [bacterium]|nr:rhomboid family intramembrane serine protease [bacterium]